MYTDTYMGSKSLFMQKEYKLCHTHIHTHTLKQMCPCTVATLVMGLCFLHREPALQLQHLSSSIFTSLLFMYIYVTYQMHTHNKLNVCQNVHNYVNAVTHHLVNF